MTTSKTFANLGFRTMPIGQAGYRLTRDEKGKKHILDKDGNVISFKQAMPANWTKEYGAQRKSHKDTPLEGLICGKLLNKEPDEVEVIALDCDNQLAWDTVRSLDPDYSFHFESIGKPGGTVIYLLPDELVDVPQFSINNNLVLEYMARRKSGANAMIYLPTEANETKNNIAKGAELNYPPATIVALLKALEPKELIAAPTVIESAKTVLPFNAPLVKQYILESKAAATKNQSFGKLKDSPIAEKVYSIFTPKDFRSVPAYKQNNWLHPNDESLLEAGPYSKYITGVSAIAGSDPSIEVSMYVDFMQALNAQLDDPYTPDRYLVEVINPMIQQKASINGKPIWKYNENWDKNSHSITNQYGETLEYFASENEANSFVEYNHSTKTLVYVKGVGPMLDRVYTMDADPQQEKPNKNLVKKLKLVQEEHSVKLAPGVFVNGNGRTIINTVEATLPLRILRQPDIFSAEVNENNLYVQAFNIFINHLVNNDKEANLFMKQLLAWHGHNLTNVPVIIYMVGVGGAGKSQFSNVLETLFGANTTRRPTALQMNSRFNDYLDNCALLVMSETADVSYQDRKNLKSTMKVVTGEKTIDIETKGKPMRPNVPVFALPLVLANDFWYEEDDNDRRLFTINPVTELAKAPVILEFENEHGVRIVDFIIEGIKQGYISKYLSKYLVKQLPPVPMTQDKINSSTMQDDIIKTIKATVSNKNWFQLFDWFDEYDITGFRTIMEVPDTNRHKITTCNHLYVGTLVDLAKAMREGSSYPADSTIKKAFLPNGWQGLKSQFKNNNSASGPNSYKKVGRYKWAIDGLLEAYEEWKVARLEETDGEF